MGLRDTDPRVLALGVARMADAVGNSFLVVLLPAYVASIVGRDGVVVGGSALATPLLVGIVLSLFGVLNSSLQPFTGRLSDRLGKRKAFILGGLALLGGASGVYPFVDSYLGVLALRGLQGIGAALTIPATVALVSELGDAASRGGNFGIYNSFRLIGFGTGPFVAGGVQELYGFAAAFGVAVVSAAAGFLLIVALIDDPEQAEADATENVSIAIRGTDSWLDPTFALGLATVVMAMGLALFATLEGPVNERLDQGAFLFGAQFGATVLANVVLQAPIGAASDRFGRRPFILAGFVVLVPATAAQGFVDTSLGMLTARTVQGIGVATVFAPSLALAGDLAGRGQAGSTLSVLTTGFSVGVAIGPLVSGVLVAVGYAVPFLAVAGIGVFALVLVYSQVPEPTPEQTEPPTPPTPGE